MAYEDIYEVTCPYCSESIELDFDFSEGASHGFTMDCPVCCRPIEIVVRQTRTGLRAEARRELE